MLPMQSTGSRRRTRPAQGGKEDDMTRTAHGFRVRWALVLLAATTTVGCSTKQPDSSSAPAKYLFVWAGPHGSDSAAGEVHGGAGASDFVAVIDADPASGTYGKVLASTAVGIAGAMAHHTEFTLPAGRALFASDYMTGKIFLLDLADPLAPRLAHRIDSVPGFRRPHSFARLPNGNVVASLQFGNGSVPGDPGGLAEFDTAGRLLHSASAADSTFPGARIRPYGVEVLPAIDRAVTTSTPMDVERTADVIQIWRLSDFRLLRTISVPAIAGDSIHYYPFEIRALPDGRTALLNTYYCGFYLLTGLETESPKVALVHSMREPRRVGCAVPVVVGRYWAMPIAYDHRIVSLDLADPSHPLEVSALRTDSTFLPHWAAVDPGSDRIVIVGQDDGEGVLMARLDRVTGRLSWDEGFREANSARRGVSFDRHVWPHGTVTAAMPHAALFGPARR